MIELIVFIGLVIIAFYTAFMIWRFAKKHVEELYQQVERFHHELLDVTLTNIDTRLRIRKKFIDANCEFDYDDFKWLSEVKYYKETQDTKWFVELNTRRINYDNPDELSLKKPDKYFSQVLYLRITDGYISSFKKSCSNPETMMYLISIIKILDYILDNIILLEHKRNIKLILDQLIDNLSEISTHNIGAMRLPSIILND